MYALAYIYCMLSLYSRWKECEPQLHEGFKALRKEISKSTLARPKDDIFLILRIPGNVTSSTKGFYQENKSSNKRKLKGGFRSTRDGSWHSVTSSTALEGCVLNKNRLWRFAFAALYVANVDRPNATRMASLSLLERSNCYQNLLPKFLSAKTTLIRTFGFQSEDPVERAKTLLVELLRKRD